MFCKQKQINTYLEYLLAQVDGLIGEENFSVVDNVINRLETDKTKMGHI